MIGKSMICSVFLWFHLTIANTLFSNYLAGIYLDQNDLVYIKEHNNYHIRCNLNQCSSYYNQYGLMREYAPAELPNASGIKTTLQGTQNQCLAICEQLTLDKKGKSDTLLVFTTCNHLDMTLLSLGALKSSPDSFDLIVVDDHSIDGTPEILLKKVQVKACNIESNIGVKGYFVVQKPYAQGLTHSWNTGYRLAVMLGYKYVIFSNNDVLVPHGAIDEVRLNLPNEALLVPLTTRKGAGHNPTQGAAASHYLNRVQAQFVNNANNFQIVQNMFSDLKAAHGGQNALVKSMWRSKCKFNGFFFAINILLLRPVALEGNTLFEPENIMVSQEDSLIQRMELNNIIPKICRYAFVYHFKSITVKASNFIPGTQNETRNDLSHYHPEIASSYQSTHWFGRAYELVAAAKRVPGVAMYPSRRGRKVIGFVGSKSVYSKELVARMSAQMRGMYDVDVRIVGEESNIYRNSFKDVDVVISTRPDFDPQRINSYNPSILVLGCVFPAENSWFWNRYLGSYDALLVWPETAGLIQYSLQELPTYCAIRCHRLLEHFSRLPPTRVVMMRDETVVSTVYDVLEELSCVLQPAAVNLSLASRPSSECALAVALRVQIGDTTSVVSFVDSFLEQYKRRVHNRECSVDLYITQPHAASPFQLQFLRNVVDIASMKDTQGGVNVQLFFDPFFHDTNHLRGRGTSDDIDQLVQYMFSKSDSNWVMITEASHQYKTNWLHDVLKAMFEHHFVDALMWDHLSSSSSGADRNANLPETISSPLLGEVIFKRELIKTSNMHFMSFSPTLEVRRAQESRVLQSVLRTVPAENIRRMQSAIMKPLTESNFLSWERVFGGGGRRDQV